MRMRYLMLLCCLALAFLLGGCKRVSTIDGEAPEQLTLYSIDGRDFEAGQEPKTKERFHGYPVLGKVDVKDAAQRKEIIAALMEGLARSNGKAAGCFWPRHAIRAVGNGRTIDYVICFECFQLREYEDNSTGSKTVTREPQAVFNKHLKAAGVPLAPGMVGDK